ncbi:MAG: polyprenyl synthetase family protein [Candidatus Gracilibacteria bacterium]|nr:polyprenyl synthetase family protein [Candidatus Gracilibacteria bacterium]
MLPTWYIDYKNFIDESIKGYLNTYFASQTSSQGLEKLKEASLYACNGGKRIRAILALEFFFAFSGKTLGDIKQNDDVVKFAIALELIHAYSLVHDDLPAMDNDDFRRGEPTTWKAYGEYTAILVGDLLNSLAFEIISEINNSDLSKKLSKLLRRSIGFFGMVGGQMEDMHYEEENSKNLSFEQLKSLHSKKTGALIKTSVLGGFYIFGNNVEKEQNLEIYSEKIGFAFQLKDDILDVEGSLETTGKSVGGEEKGFVSVFGLEESKKNLDNLISESTSEINFLNSEKLNFLTEYIKKREK